ncbi:polysaccharide deacetylase family protein [Shewanella dokdonensis]|uniref:Polysaccharide deacetylase family protein n=1 Tax=Shewanella dokdonensis TaxID=712036 RepID=A0ABX8DIK5_9GAMM|nr:polysaccharide deacetylase family protein [Shewanella dokdonensis]MCL1075524.1 polysaccharide deacetylase family protein [Shewanella dokdonensis]QVK24550.1 polysaccharide deacetylase family protein [Shewanella dokdonensis]
MLCGLRVLFTLALLFTTQGSWAAVILQYHHVSETTPKVTSVTPAQFKQQMQYLADNNFHVVPLAEVVQAIKRGQELPAKTVVITFDDGYRSIFETARPILKSLGFPYTLFVSVTPTAKGYREMMSWQQLRQLADEGVTIANHSYGHEHLIRKLPGETEAQWLARIKQNLQDTEAELMAKTGQDVKMLAYPYGEYNTALQQLLSALGYVGLGQQSGAAGTYSSLTALPRFPVAGAYANMASLQVKLQARNMPVLSSTPTNPELSDGNWRPTLQLTLEMQDINPEQLLCYLPGQDAVKPAWTSKNSFQIQATKPLPVGRSRYNCTVPSKHGSGYYWFSQAWVRPDDQGQWLHE